MNSFETLLNEVRHCNLCSGHLPFSPKPILQFHPQARILIAGQAPGKKAHEAGLPFSDASGKRLREWLGLTPDVFYDPKRLAILPMGFCFPGSGKSGDLPPRPECAPTWRDRLVRHLTQLKLTLVIGQYAQAYYFPDANSSVTDNVRCWRKNWPILIPLPHPSPRNTLWLQKNTWFGQELLPSLRTRIAEVLADNNQS